MDRERKTYVAKIPKEMGKELDVLARKLGLDFQRIVRMLIRRGIDEQARKHQKVKE